MTRRKVTGFIVLAVIIISVLSACRMHSAPKESADLRLLEFPGTHWNDTPEAVIEALGISDEQILENQAIPDESGTGVCEDWNLVVSGLKCLDVETAQAHFRFTRYGKDTNYGLAYVKVTLPEDAKMQDMASAVTDYFGVSAVDTLPSYDLRDGAVEARSEDMGTLSYGDDSGVQATLPLDGGNNLYWLAGVTGTEYLSQEQKQKVIDVYTQSDVASESVTQWMELQPLAYILLSDNGNALSRVTGEDVSPNVLVFSGQQFLFLTQYFS